MSSLAQYVAPVIRRSLSTPVIMRSLSTSTPISAKQLSPQIQKQFDKLKKNQEFFQREDGNWIFMKKPTDKVQLGLIILFTVLGLGYNATFAYDKLTGKY